MEARLNYMKTAPGAYKAMLGMEKYLHESGLEIPLLHMVKLRASQRATGETEQRLYSLDAWRECPYYTDRERAALEWPEAVTLVTNGHVPDEVYESVRPHFSTRKNYRTSRSL